MGGKESFFNNIVDEYHVLTITDGNMNFVQIISLSLIFLIEEMEMMRESLSCGDTGRSGV